jgi:hypothetical protein
VTLEKFRADIYDQNITGMKRRRNGPKEDHILAVSIVMSFKVVDNISARLTLSLAPDLSSFSSNPASAS